MFDGNPPYTLKYTIFVDILERATCKRIKDPFGILVGDTFEELERKFTNRYDYVKGITAQKMGIEIDQNIQSFEELECYLLANVLSWFSYDVLFTCENVFYIERLMKRQKNMRNPFVSM